MKLLTTRLRLLAAGLFLVVATNASAVPSEFVTLIQATAGAPLAPIHDGLFQRQTYSHAGALIQLYPWQRDEELQRQVYAVQPGETWDCWWWDLETGRLIAVMGVTFLGGDQYCWSDGFCGTATHWWAALPFRCMPEHGRVRVDTFHNNLPLGGGNFRPTRFVPKLAAVEMPSFIEPKRWNHAQGQAADIQVRVTDDIECHQAIEAAHVRIAATVGTNKNSQNYLVTGDRGTGRFEGIGAAAVAPDGTVVEGATNAQGSFGVRYRALDHALEETLTFEVTRPATSPDPALSGTPITKELRIEIPGLVQIMEHNAPVGFRDGGGCPHNPKPHWLTPRTLAQVTELAQIYQETTGRKLSLNDASLEMGGVIANFDEEGRDAHCHGSHRQGIDVDVNQVDASWVNMTIETVQKNGAGQTLHRFMDALVVERFGGTLHHTYRRGNLTSIHWRLP